VFLVAIPTCAMKAVLELRGVHKSYFTAAGRVDVLKGVDLAIAPGEFVAITGPSGSGKSTLLNLAALLDHPTSGQVLVDGEDVSNLDTSGAAEIRKLKIGMVFQQFHLLAGRNVRENVAFRFRYTSTPRHEAYARADEALHQFGIGHLAERPARLLSGGEMQRVAIARAVALRPVLLVADEPTGNLDKASADAVLACFQRMSESGIAVLLVTHNEALLSYCRRHFDCRDGRLEAKRA
jgi:lipoprotein-releasing system ATP-binding protein